MRDDFREEGSNIRRYPEVCPYFPFPREVADDTRLSMAALGIFAWLESLPEDHPGLTEEAIAARCGGDMNIVKAAIDELAALGHASRRQS